MDFNAENFHDYSLLTEYSSLEDFLCLYADLAFVEYENAVVARQKDEEIKILRKKCIQCNIEDPLLGSACEYASEFAKGTVIELQVDSSRMMCKKCEIPFYGKGDGEPAKVRVHDVRMCGTPTVLSISRENLKCPQCHQRIEAIPIPGVQNKKRGGLSIRLLVALAKEACGAVPQKLCAQGYGIDAKTVRKYNEELAAINRRECDKKDAKIIREMTEDSVLKKEVGNNKILFMRKTANVGDTMQHLCFSCNLSGESLQRTTKLRAAFGDEFETLSCWLRGEFHARMSRRLSNVELTRLAFYYTATECSEVPHILAYLTTELVIAYTQARQRQERPIESDTFELVIAACSDVGTGGTAEWFGIDDYASYILELQSIVEWAKIRKEQKVLRTGTKLLKYVLGSNQEIELVIQKEYTNEDLTCPEDVNQLIEETVCLLESNTTQCGRSAQEIWGNIFYLNPAVVPLVIKPDGTATFPITSDGRIDTVYLPPTGISAQCLNYLLAQGFCGREDHGVISCSLQKFQCKDEQKHPCNNTNCPWVF